MFRCKLWVGPHLKNDASLSSRLEDSGSEHVKTTNTNHTKHVDKVFRGHFEEIPQSVHVMLSSRLAIQIGYGDTITWFRRIAHLFCALLDMASLRFLYKFGLVRGHLKTDASICRCFTQNTFQPLPAFPRLSRNWIFPRPRAVAERGPSQQQPLHNFRPVPSDWQDVHGIVHAPMPWYQSCFGTRRARSCCPARR